MPAGLVQNMICCTVDPQMLTFFRGPGKFEMAKDCWLCALLIFHCNTRAPASQTCSGQEELKNHSTQRHTIAMNTDQYQL
mmetsp:Transcript_21791/g.34156  ORF Transcript_21791/g.34156 Transcript_21791/m.34156 type:complete len:80 (+) Transcript_21791:833-1072(+)